MYDKTRQYCPESNFETLVVDVKQKKKKKRRTRTKQKYT